jgi:hypothetical protein
LPDLYRFVKFLWRGAYPFIVEAINRYDRNMTRLRKEMARSTVAAVLLMWIG